MPPFSHVKCPFRAPFCEKVAVLCGFSVKKGHFTWETTPPEKIVTRLKRGAAPVPASGSSAAEKGGGGVAVRSDPPPASTPPPLSRPLCGFSSLPAHFTVKEKRAALRRPLRSSARMIIIVSVAASYTGKGRRVDRKSVV